MNILITGVAGYIGSNFCKRIAEKNKNYKIITLDNINDYYPKKIKYLRLKELKKIKNVKFFKLDLINKTSNKAIVLRSLQHLSQLPYEKLDPFRKGQILACLEKLGFNGESASVRSLALKIYTKIDLTYNSSKFLLASLQDKNKRVVANTLEVLTSVEYPSASEVIYPFLNSSIR